MMCGWKDGQTDGQNNGQTDSMMGGQINECLRKVRLNQKGAQKNLGLCKMALAKKLISS